MQKQDFDIFSDNEIIFKNQNFNYCSLCKIEFGFFKNQHLQNGT